MPPEQPPYLVILDTSIGVGRVQGRVEYLKPTKDRLRVRWGVGSPTAGYQKEGGGVVFVADQSATPSPPDENPSVQIVNGQYVYQEGLAGAEWLMLVMILVSSKNSSRSPPSRNSLLSAI